MEPPQPVSTRTPNRTTSDASVPSRYAVQTQVFDAAPGSLCFSVENDTGNIDLDQSTSDRLWQSGSYQLMTGQGVSRHRLVVKSFWPFTLSDQVDAKIETTLAKPTHLYLSQSGTDHSNLLSQSGADHAWLVLDPSPGHFDTLVTAKNMRPLPLPQQIKPGWTRYQASAVVTGKVVRADLREFIRDRSSNGTQ